MGDSSMGMVSHSRPPFLLVLLFACSLAFAAGGAFSASIDYVRPRPRETLSIRLDEDADGATPQQVHISMAGERRVRVTWITENEAPAIVEYGAEEGKYGESRTGSTSDYTFATYKSGKIHEVVIGPLDPGKVYYYQCGGHHGREFSLKTPPARLPIRFTVVGDLGQTGWTKSTLEHISKSNSDMLLLPGDLSYADLDQKRWDTFGRFVEPLASSRPWMVTEGNHEIETIPFIESTPFKPYNARWHMPYEDSGSPSNLFYSFDIAGGAVHFLMLGSYTEFAAGSNQYKWLSADLAKLDRSKTLWVFALIHAPWYNSNKAHQGDGEEMRKALEELLYAAGVDAVFAGHVHAYERFTSVYKNKEDECGPVHFTVGDGGNREGLASKYKDPQPSISMFREASFGHGQLYVVNATHALWSWYRNDDDEPVVADSAWITSLASNPACQNKS